MYFKRTIVNTLINIGYAFLYCFSLCQIKVNQVKLLASCYTNKSIKYLKDHNILSTSKMRTMHFIDNGSGIAYERFTTAEIHLLSMIKHIFETKTGISLLLTDVDDATGFTNVLFMNECPKTIVYTLSTINFILVELEYKSEKYVITLKSKDFNYYVVDNTLDDIFFKYYTNTILKIPTTEPFDYKVTIIDHNVNSVTLLPGQSLVFKEDDYNLVLKQA